MTLDEIRREHAREVVGPHILAEVAQICRAVSRSYSPVIYAGVTDWEDGFDDLVQEVVLNRLLSEAQLEYILTVASKLEDFRRLVARQVRRSLAHRRRRTVVDNVLERAVRILSEGEYMSRGTGSRRRYSLRGRAAHRRTPTDAEVYKVALGVAAIPRVRPHGLERAPVVYSPEALKAAIHVIATGLETDFALDDLDRIFRLVLTDWLAGDLLDIREVESEATDAQLGPDEVSEVESITEDILRQLSAEGRRVLAFKYVGMSDGDIARRLDVSRPTVAKRKEQALQIIRDQLRDASSAIQESVVSEVAIRVAGGTDAT